MKKVKICRGKLNWNESIWKKYIIYQTERWAWRYHSLLILLITRLKAERARGVKINIDEERENGKCRNGIDSLSFPPPQTVVDFDQFMKLLVRTTKKNRCKSISKTKSIDPIASINQLQRVRFPFQCHYHRFKDVSIKHTHTDITSNSPSSFHLHD